jgi:hypothetical protein
MQVLTGGEADDPNVEEVEVGEAGLGLVDIVQPAPGAPPVVLLPPRLQQWRRRASAAAGHLLLYSISPGREMERNRPRSLSPLRRERERKREWGLLLVKKEM